MLAEVKLACQRLSIPELAKALGNVSEATATWVDAPSIPFSCFRKVLRKKVSRTHQKKKHWSISATPVPSTVKF